MASTLVLNDIAAPSRITKFAPAFQTNTKRFPNGRLARQCTRLSPVYNFEIEYDALTLGEYTALQQFFMDRRGMYESFVFRDTHTNQTYNVVFSDDQLARENASPNVRGLYQITIELESV
ncbi:DUF2460 domain-containing protein [Niveispirillum sp. KHB5.9]|uniref:DUF2460 domain-containing protein n=1 Tax=Niveispirillum sp. KHB5.9 TaxID=3400269 RepID=UPI003A871A96